MPLLTLQIPPKGRLVLLGWASLAGGLLLPFCFGYALLFGVFCLGALGAGLGCIWYYSKFVRLTVLSAPAQGAYLQGEQTQGASPQGGLSQSGYSQGAHSQREQTQAASPRPVFLQIETGRHHQHRTQILCRAIYLQSTYRTPLLRAAGCQILVCHTAARAFVCPPLQTQTVHTLTTLLQQGG